MIEIFIRKLEAFGPLSAADKQVLAAMPVQQQVIAADVDIIREGERPQGVNLVLDGIVCRYKLLNNGNRQIVAYLLPGDICDLHVFVLDAMDHNIATLSEATVAKLTRTSVDALLERPAIARALLMTTLVEEATSREWLTNLGQRPADRRVAHLLCEWHLRLAIVGLAKDGECELPITQAELADTMGLSTVHVNRSLQSLREQGLIVLKQKTLSIADVQRLRKFSGFRSNYLHLKDETAIRAMSHSG